MPSQSYSTVWTAYVSEAEDEVSVGDVLIPNAAGTAYVVATAANRATAIRTTTGAGVALTAWDGQNPNRAVEIQTVGPCPQSITGLSSGTATTLRVSDAGRLERGTPGIAAGNCDADGFAYLNFTGSGGGGGGDTVTFSGDLSGPDEGPQVVERIKGTTVTTAGGALATGGVLRATGVATADWGPLDLADSDARTGVLPTANGGTGLSSAGSDGNVLTASGGVWVSSAPGSGAPSNAQYLTLATNASLSNERVFTPSTGLSAVDGGANGNYTLSCTFTPSSTDTLTNKTFSILSNTLVSSAVGQLLKGVSGGTFDYFARGANGAILTSTSTDLSWLSMGSALQVLRVNAAGNGLEYATPSTTSPGGSNTELQYNNGGAFGGTGNLAYNSGGLLVASAGFITMGAGTASAAGILRFGATASDMMTLRISSTNTSIISHDGSGTVYFGSNAAATVSATGVRLYGTTSAYVGTTTSGANLECTTVDTGLRFNVRGSGTALTLKVASVTMSNTGGVDTTPTASQLECPIIKVTLAAGGEDNYLLLPAVTGAFYIIDGTNAAVNFFINTTDTGGATCTAGKKVGVYYNGSAYTELWQSP